MDYLPSIDSVYIDNKRTSVVDYCYMFKELGEHEVVIRFKDKLTSCQNMFELCSQIKSVDLSNFDSSAVKDMSSMFSYCSNLQSIKGFRDFNATNVEDINRMLQCCYSLKEIDLSAFAGSNIKNYSYLFDECHQLKKVVGSENIRINPDSTFNDIFTFCKSLTHIDLSAAKLKTTPTFLSVFNYTSNLVYIKGDVSEMRNVRFGNKPQNKMGKVGIFVGVKNKKSGLNFREVVPKRWKVVVAKRESLE